MPIDYNITQTERDIESQEEQTFRACVETAAKHGHKYQTAWACDNFSVGCPDCPFKPKPCSCGNFVAWYDKVTCANCGGFKNV